MQLAHTAKVYLQVHYGTKQQEQGANLKGYWTGAIISLWGVCLCQCETEKRDM